MLAEDEEPIDTKIRKRKTLNYTKKQRYNIHLILRLCNHTCLEKYRSCLEKIRHRDYGTNLPSSRCQAIQQQIFSLTTPLQK